ncbi:MAG: hypothetical protein WAU58_01625 [Terriglobales bacterium]
MLNVLQRGSALVFETKDKSDTVHWRLTPEKGSEGRLHGSIGEMLIDEKVVKSP